MQASQLRLQDTDSDGFVDLVVADRGVFHWFRNFNDERLIPLSVGSGFPFDGSMVQVDFDNDGDLDWVTGFVFPKALGFVENSCCHGRSGTVLVANPSFETPDTASGVSGWLVTGEATSVPSSAAADAPASGSRVATVGPIGIIKQTLDASLAAAPFVQLRMAVGWFSKSTFPTIVAELRADPSNTLLASVSISEQDFTLGPGAIDELVLTANLTEFALSPEEENLVIIIAVFGEDPALVDNIRISSFR